MAGRAVVALEPNDRGTGKILLEAQDVADLGTPPGVDRLVVVPDAGDVLPRLSEEAQPEILCDVGILVFVHQDRPEAPLIVPEQVRGGAQHGQTVQQQVAEIGGIEGQKTALIGFVESQPSAEGEIAHLRGRHLVRAPALVLPALDQAQERPRRPALLVEIGALDHLLDEPELVVGVEDREARPEAHQLGMAAKKTHADGVERAQPHALHAPADQPLDAPRHLARGLVREGDGQDLARPGPAGDHQVRDAGGQDPRLARARTRQYEQGPVRRRDGSQLLGIEPLQMGR